MVIFASSVLTQQKFRKIFVAGDHYRLSREAHDLKTNAVNIGFMELYEICKALDKEVAGIAGSELNVCIEKIDKYIDEAMEICRKYTHG